MTTNQQVVSRTERMRERKTMTTHKTGTRKDWLAARLELLKEEKELTRRGDELAQRRQEYKRRMGWTFPWASSFASDFNFGFSVGFTEGQQREGSEYNFTREPELQWRAGQQSGGAGA